MGNTPLEVSLEGSDEVSSPCALRAVLRVEERPEAAGGGGDDDSENAGGGGEEVPNPHIVQLTLTNTGDQPVTVLLQGWVPLLRVQDEAGKSLKRFDKPPRKRALPGRDNYTALAPGESVTARESVCGHFIIEEGRKYKVQLDSHAVRVNPRSVEDLFTTPSRSGEPLTRSQIYKSLRTVRFRKAAVIFESERTTHHSNDDDDW